MSVQVSARGTWRTIWAACAVALIVGGLPVEGWAKTLFVDGSSGNDSVSYDDNSEARPWRTIGRAAWGSTNRSSANTSQAARAGDVVRVAAGTYVTTGTGNRWGVAYQPVNQGSAGNHITFEGVGAVVLTYSGGAGPMIGSNGRDYIRWKNFIINEANAPYSPDSGPVIVWGSRYVILENLTLVGRNNGPVRGDNYNGVRLEFASHIEIRNCVISGFGRGADNTNHTGITTYYSGNLLIENNEIANSGTGIYLKANFDNGSSASMLGRVTVRYNHIHGNIRGVSMHRNPTSADAPTLFYQNVVQNNTEAGFWFKSFDHGNTDPTHGKVFNNTFVNNGKAVWSYNPLKVGSGHLVQNNIIVGGQIAMVYSDDERTVSYRPDIILFVRNMVSGVGSYGRLHGTNRNLSQWRSATGQDTESIESNPMFVNASGSDFRLQAGSPARALGRAVYNVGGANGATIPAGAYITGSELIGPGNSSNPFPGAPRNLRITTP